MHLFKYANFMILVLFGRKPQTSEHSQNLVNFEIQKLKSSETMISSIWKPVKRPKPFSSLLYRNYAALLQEWAGKI